MLTEEDRVLGHQLAGDYLEQVGYADADGAGPALPPGRPAGPGRALVPRGRRAGAARDRPGRRHRPRGARPRPPSPRSSRTSGRRWSRHGGGPAPDPGRGPPVAGGVRPGGASGAEAMLVLRPGSALWFRAVGQTLVGFAKQANEVGAAAPRGARHRGRGRRRRRAGGLSGLGGQLPVHGRAAGGGDRCSNAWRTSSSGWPNPAPQTPPWSSRPGRSRPRPGGPAGLPRAWKRRGRLRSGR